ncbi:MAG: tRNA uridine-5-carboxymethylaminomethyl(34) synthesis GTPase MnmE [Rikenellaceae bacterium]
MRSTNDIIVAPATLTGGAIAIVRLSGEGSIALCDKVFRARKGTLAAAATHTLHYGEIIDGDRVVDDTLVSIFRAPHSYTGEESVEISCHGSQYIVQEIIALLLKHGAHTAEAGEFTTRAYLAGRMDLSQAEAVADMIASTSKAQHTMASTQMRGGYSSRLSELRELLVELAALLELELDFSEEEVEFADRSHLSSLMESLSKEIEKLAESFAVGNAIKKGVPVAIIGEPNVGKSTLLNCLLGEKRAMVSEIAGTTRDLIEEELVLDGITFRFIDTAGIHETDDKLELMGIERTLSAIEKAQIIIHLTDAEIGSTKESESGTKIEAEIGVKISVKTELKNEKIDNQSISTHLNNLRKDQKIIEVINKIDIRSNLLKNDLSDKKIRISAKEQIGIDNLRKELRSQIDTQALYEGSPIVSNLRHHDLLNSSLELIKTAQQGIQTSLPTDLICQDIREVLHNIGSITGSITTTDILTTIFSKFCIGK